MICFKLPFSAQFSTFLCGRKGFACQFPELEQRNSSPLLSSFQYDSYIFRCAWHPQSRAQGIGDKVSDFCWDMEEVVASPMKRRETVSGGLILLTAVPSLYCIGCQLFQLLAWKFKLGCAESVTVVHLHSSFQNFIVSFTVLHIIRSL